MSYHLTKDVGALQKTDQKSATELVCPEVITHTLRLPYPHHPLKVLLALLLQAFLLDPDPRPYLLVQSGPSLPERNNDYILRCAIRI